MTDTDVNRCPAADCDAFIPLHAVACPQDWQNVSELTRHDIADAYATHHTKALQLATRRATIEMNEHRQRARQ